MGRTHENRGESLSPVAAAWRALAPLMDLVTPMALRVAATLRLADEMPDQGSGRSQPANWPGAPEPAPMR
jgi:hypothetical protein